MSMYIRDNGQKRIEVIRIPHTRVWGIWCPALGGYIDAPTEDGEPMSRFRTRREAEAAAQRRINEEW